jgi:hypothetical protein
MPAGRAHERAIGIVLLRSVGVTVSAVSDAEVGGLIAADMPEKPG